jgi:molybdopterin-guanine dinucleotide biosynthesis protein A
MWAKESGADWLATFPCDAPFLPHDLVACLLAASQLGHPCAAEDTSGFQGACALWPAVCLDRLHDAVESNRVRSVHGALEMLEATRCRFADGNAFFNVNTPEDLAQAEERAKRSPI